MARPSLTNGDVAVPGLHVHRSETVVLLGGAATGARCAVVERCDYTRLLLGCCASRTGFPSRIVTRPTHAAATYNRKSTTTSVRFTRRSSAGHPCQVESAVSLTTSDVHVPPGLSIPVFGRSRTSCQCQPDGRTGACWRACRSYWSSRETKEASPCARSGLPMTVRTMIRRHPSSST